MLYEFIKPSIDKSPIYIKIDDPSKEEKFADWHYHEDIEMLWIKKGELYLSINKQDFTLQEGDILFVDSYVPHTTKTPIGTEKVLLQFKHDLLLSEQIDKIVLKPFIKSPNHFVVFRKSTLAGQLLILSFEKINNEFISQKKSYLSFVKAHFYEILAILYRFGTLMSPDDYSLPKQAKLLFPALQYAVENIDKPISLDEISTVAHLDRSYFCRLFNKNLQMTFSEYLCILRMQKAEKLLLYSNKTITEIALSCGFGSPAYFTKIFKEKKGFTPTFYKHLKKRVSALPQKK